MSTLAQRVRYLVVRPSDQIEHKAVRALLRRADWTSVYDFSGAGKDADGNQIAVPVSVLTCARACACRVSVTPVAHRWCTRHRLVRCPV
jgi:hypothetical protein